MEASTTILISLINGFVKFWNYDNLSLYIKFTVNNVIDFSYFVNDKVPYICLLTLNKYIHVFKFEEYWQFSKINKYKLKKSPQDFIMYKDKGIISYSDNYEFISEVKDKNGRKRLESTKLLSKTLVEKSAPIIYMDFLKAFIISKARFSYYVDWSSGNINKGSSIKIVWKQGAPIKVLLVKPYLIGLMEDGIEIKCMFNPNKVVQIVKDPCFTNCQVAISQEITQNNFLIKLDSLYVYSLEQSEESNEKNIHRISEYYQIDGKNQVNALIENQLYSTSMKICEFFMNKNYEQLNNQEYLEFQKGRAFYCFYAKKDFKLALSLLK